MSQQTTIRKLAELVNAPVEKLLEQLAEAGMRFDGPDQVVTSTEKMKLLGFLRRTHGKADKPAEEAAAPKKITLSRSRKQELTVGGGKNRSTVDVVVRKKVTWSSRPRSAGAPGAADRRARRDPAQARGIAPAQPDRAAAPGRGRQAPRRGNRRAPAPARPKPPRATRRGRAHRRVAGATRKARRKAAHGHGHGHPKPAAPRVEEKARPQAQAQPWFARDGRRRRGRRQRRALRRASCT